MNNATVKQNEILSKSRYLLGLIQKLTKTEITVLHEFILLTDHGMKNNIRIHQGELAKNLNYKKPQLNKAINNLILKDFIAKDKENHYSINIELITNVKTRIKAIDTSITDEQSLQSNFEE